MPTFERLIQSFRERRVRFVVIGLAGANYYARSAGSLFVTQDRDLFLAPTPDNVLRSWAACETLGLQLFSGDEPLDVPRDRLLAERVVSNRALVRASDAGGLDVDLTLVMTGFEFDSVWKSRRVFRVDDIEIPVARLAHIVDSKRRAGRDKDRLFFATHAEAISDLMRLDKGRTRAPQRRRQRRRQPRE